MLIIRAMLIVGREKGQCLTDDKSYVDCWWEEGQCWTDNKSYVGGDWGEGTVLG